RLRRSRGRARPGSPAFSAVLAPGRSDRELSLQRRPLRNAQPRGDDVADDRATLADLDVALRGDGSGDHAVEPDTAGVDVALDPRALCNDQCVVSHVHISLDASGEGGVLGADEIALDDNGGTDPRRDPALAPSPARRLIVAPIDCRLACTLS